MSDIERYTASDPCPICGGWDRLPRGGESRCFGFWSSDREYAHCTREEHAGGLQQNTQSQTYAHRMKGPCRCGKTHGESDPAPMKTARGRIVARYDYVDESGTMLFQAVRYEPKTFSQRRPDPAAPGGWSYDLKGVRRVLYRLPELVEAPEGSTVYLCEGEKDVDRLRSLGLLATCNPMGAGKWRDEFSPSLKGFHVVVLPHNDKPGQDHARTAAASVLPFAASVKVVDLVEWCEPLNLSPLPEKGDVSDWLDLGGTAADLDWIEGRTEPLSTEAANGDPGVISLISHRNGEPEEEEDDDTTPLPPPDWIDPPDPIIYHGLAGEIALAIEPTTEADPLGLLIGLLLGAGSIAGRTAYYKVEGARHYANDYAILVGDSGTGKKGTSAARVKEVLSLVDHEWCLYRNAQGLSSGEGLLTAVRDPIYVKQPIKEKGRVIDYQSVMTDEGVSDKRLHVIEEEFGGLLRVKQREGNRLTVYLRGFWDSGTQQSLTKSPLKATDAHVSIIGHITEQELKELLVGSDIFNGFANRFEWYAVRRTRFLPFGGEGFDPRPFADRLRAALEAARDLGEVKMDHAAKVLWESSYKRLTTPAPGKLGAITNRAAPHVARKALQYAILDRESWIGEEHVAAALALWSTSFRCAARIFGSSIGHPKAERILAALKAAPGGLTRTEINDRVFQHHEKKAVIKEALQHLIKHGLATEDTETATGGRPRVVYRAREACEKSEKSEITPAHHGGGAEEG